jgi:hypothetical protein
VRAVPEEHVKLVTTHRRETHIADHHRLGERSPRLESLVRQAAKREAQEITTRVVSSRGVDPRRLSSTGEPEPTYLALGRTQRSLCDAEQDQDRAKLSVRGEN